MDTEAILKAITRLAEAIERQNELMAQSLETQKENMAKTDGMQSMLTGMLQRVQTG